MHPWSSLFTPQMKININTALFDASPRYTFICKTEQLGWTESVCLWGLWRMCVFFCVRFFVFVSVCIYLSKLLHLKDLIMLMIHPVQMK